MEDCLISLKSASSEADIVTVIQNALESENLAESPESSAYWKLLEIFAFETLSYYRSVEAQLPKLNEKQTEKLKHLTLVSLASDAKVIPYNVLMKELEFSTEQQVEDMVIATIYKNLLSAKLDQQRQLIEIEYVIGRDVRRSDLQKIRNMLSEWSTVCEQALADISSNIEISNSQAASRKTEERSFTMALQELRTSHAVAFASGKGADRASRNDSQFSSSEYRNEEMRTGGGFE
ncbi:COP9 signalosome complex subunit 7b [Coemansia erecta]|uniref:COP9 signalosome complex subunit 7b n=1 Tax=Coemansia erecta TaxID=147472 RepID=A0A9W7XWF1_9FUNG|nr:COP9 signalosome complex subunit 7b [Coemansia erecta]